MTKKPSFKLERHLWKMGYEFILGIDEVGRGAFAGPLVAAAVVLPKKFRANGIRDSKLLSASKRNIYNEYIIKNALHYTIVEIDTQFINKYGVGEATHQAFRECIKKLESSFDFVLVDGFKIKNFDNNLQKAIIHGDNLSISIAAASIIAKVYRDNLMINLHKQIPQYNFMQNKGYGTKMHRDALKKYGLSEVHRKSFNLNKFLQ